MRTNMIGISRDGDVVTMELQRTARRNALNTEMCVQLRDGIEQAVDEDARAVVLTGEGSVFCAGADLSGDVYAEGFLDSLTGMLTTIEAAPIPVIAAVNGPAISVDRGTVRRLATLIGGGAARSVFLAAEPIHADEALARGLANRIGDLGTAQAWARDIAELAPLSLRAMKLFLNDDRTRDEPSPEQMSALAAAWLSEDAQEARAARAEKRDPVFRGM